MLAISPMVWKWCPEILFLHINLTVLLSLYIQCLKNLPVKTSWKYFFWIKFTLGVKYNESIIYVKLAWRRSSQSILENIFFVLNTISLEKKVFFMKLRSIFTVFWVKNIVQGQKTFFLCLLYIYTFPILSFHLFCEFIELGSKLGLQRA